MGDISRTVFTAVLWILVSAFQGQNIITAESGQNVTLPCPAPNNITAVNWSRTDLGKEYVLLYRDGHFDQYKQHPSFKNRVDLQDRQMKDGDMSLILKNVTAADSGTYECRVFMEETRSWKSISNNYLRVEPGASVGLNVSAVVIIVIIVISVICWKSDKRKIMDGLKNICKSLTGAVDKSEIPKEKVV